MLDGFVGAHATAAGTALLRLDLTWNKETFVIELLAMVDTKRTVIY